MVSPWHLNHLNQRFQAANPCRSLVWTLLGSATYGSLAETCGVGIPEFSWLPIFFLLVVISSRFCFRGIGFLECEFPRMLPRDLVNHRHETIGLRPFRDPVTKTFHTNAPARQPWGVWVSHPIPKCQNGTILGAPKNF